jgi:hypothetical protein
MSNRHPNPATGSAVRSGALVCIGIVCLLTAGRLFAEPVFVRQGGQNGSGYTFTDGATCYLVTAEHVVTDEAPITVVDHQRNRGIATILSRGSLLAGNDEPSENRFDVAVATLSPDSKVACTTRWNDGDASARYFSNPQHLEEPIRATRVFDSGEIVQRRLLIRRPGEHIWELVPFGRGDQFQTGDSGTFLTLTHGTETLFVGMIVRVITATDTIVALPQNWLHSLVGSSLAPPAVAATAGNIRLGISNIAERNRELAHSSALIYDALASIPELELTLGTQGDVLVTGSLLTAQPQLATNDCATRQGQVNLACALLGRPTTTYIATVPVQIEFRVNDRIHGRVVPYLYSKVLKVGANTHSEAERSAVDTAIREGIVQALVTARVIEAAPQSGKAQSSSKKKNAPTTYVVSASLKNALTANAIATSSAPPRAGLAGGWSGSYECGNSSIPLTLEIELAGEQARGTFKFCNAGNRALRVPDGIWQFALIGRTSGSVAELVPLPAQADPARRMPPGYGPVGVKLTLLDADTLAGEVTNAGCRALNLRRHRGNERGVCE